MKLASLVVCLVLPNLALALTSTEQILLSKNIYHECREKTICSKADWQKIAKVALNRVALAKQGKQKFGAKQATLQGILTSNEYTSRKKLNKPIKDKEIWVKIKKFVKQGKFGVSKATFFSTKGKGRKRKMVYR